MTDAALPSIAQIVQQYGLRASKKFGQHFLFDLNLTAKIVRESAIISTDLVFEIGPGPGGLTRPLLASGARVHVIEMDNRFLPHMAELSQYYDQRLTVHFGDALKFNLDELAAKQPYHIVANLPYNVGTALLINWLSANEANWQSMTLMFQLEVAKRIVATTGDANYGRLSILCAAVANANIVMQVPASAFTPPPKVTSAVVHLTPLPAASRYADLDGLASLTALAFGQKRKMLRASLKPLTALLDMPVSDWLQQHQIEPTARPETLSPAQFMELASQLRKKTNRS
ncbi:SSU rRNA (adenine(1518)-N(6)/adenine(1519)-N(6))-dimethyltransferase [hydrothermal vent metagenome]|uniref:SSU rRNA (Adenine(1518)-N(6)/adenine(1519)-N(6))-dimethyltransferase n=1 Tax=hydrothermal vent metagenome TaxID=652676 RepID=A0A3B0RZ42_9ZZZZ